MGVGKDTLLDVMQTREILIVLLLSLASASTQVLHLPLYGKHLPTRAAVKPSVVLSSALPRVAPATSNLLAVSHVQRSQFRQV